MKDAARYTTGMRLEAKRLGIKPSELGSGNLRDATAIDLAIGRAVKAERERCVGLVDDCGMIGSDATISLIKAINGGKR